MSPWLAWNDFDFGAASLGEDQLAAACDLETVFLGAMNEDHLARPLQYGAGIQPRGRAMSIPLRNLIEVSRIHHRPQIRHAVIATHLISCNSVALAFNYKIDL